MVLPNSSLQESSDKVVHENQSWYILLCRSSIYYLPLQLLFCSTDNCGLLSYDSCLYCYLALTNLLQIPDITGLLARKLLLLLEVCFLYLEGFPMGEQLSLQLYSYPPLQLSSLFLIGVVRQRECYGRVLKQVVARQYLILDMESLFLGFHSLLHSLTYIARLPSGTFFFFFFPFPSSTFFPPSKSASTGVPSPLDRCRLTYTSFIGCVQVSHPWDFWPLGKSKMWLNIYFHIPDCSGGMKRRNCQIV